MSRIVSLEIHKDELSFSAGHFTIFSATERENLHGHNYYVSIAFKVKIEENGLAFDYRVYKQKLQALCNKLERHFLLPAHSPYLKIEESDTYLFAHFNGQKIPFLREDVIVLPLTNVTIEELSHWFLDNLIGDREELMQHNIQEITVRVYNGPGQSGGAYWQAT